MISNKAASIVPAQRKTALCVKNIVGIKNPNNKIPICSEKLKKFIKSLKIAKKGLEIAKNINTWEKAKNSEEKQ